MTGMTYGVFGDILARSPSNAEEENKPRVLCDSDWLEYKDLDSRAGPTLKLNGKSTTVTLGDWLAKQDDAYYKEFGKSCYLPRWWLKAFESG